MKIRSLRVAALLTATVCATTMMLAACGEEEHKHTLQEVAAVAATCTTAGSEAYYKCTDSTCGKLFSDAEGKTEITAIPTIAATGHDMTKHDEVSATCTTDGTKEYYTCSHEAATVYYADEQGTEKLTDLTIKANGHDMTKHDAVAPTCEQEGNKAYWTCANEPGVVYANAEGTETTTMDQITVAKRQHSIEPVTGIPATCAATGTQAHYQCLSCKKIYSDEQGEHEITDPTELTIPKSETHTGMPIFAYESAPDIVATGAELDATCFDCKQAIKVSYAFGENAGRGATAATVLSTEKGTTAYIKNTSAGRTSIYVAVKASQAGTYTLSFSSVYSTIDGIVKEIIVGSSLVSSTLPSQGCIFSDEKVGVKTDDTTLAVAANVAKTILFNGAAYDPANMPKNNFTITFTLTADDVASGDVYFNVCYYHGGVQTSTPLRSIFASYTFQAAE